MIRGSGAAAAALFTVLGTATVAGTVTTTTTSTSTTTSTTTTTTIVAPAPSGLPLYQFAKTATGALPWVASLVPLLASGQVAAGPRIALGPSGRQVVAFMSTARTIGFTLTSAGATSLTVLGPGQGLAPAADAPTPFYDHYGHLNFAYVSTTGHVVLVTNDPQPLVGVIGGPTRFTHREWLVHDLTSSLGATLAARGQLAAYAGPTNDVLALRTVGSTLVALTLGAQRPFVVSDATTVATGVASDPVVVGPLSDGVITLAATSTAGHLLVLRHGTGVAWTSTDVTATTVGPVISGSLAAASNLSTLFVAGLQQGSSNLVISSGVLTGSTFKWTTVNVTKNVANSPPLAGRIAAAITGSTLHVAGQAAGWGDLFDYAGAGSPLAWTATDVSAAAGPSAKTIAGQVAIVPLGANPTLLAGGVATPAPRGVGVYAIPLSKYSTAIADGWRILADTGGLGTTSAPWVNTTTTPATSSLDYATGNAIQSSHKRVTWFSFWTISGPIGAETYAPATFQSHGFAAGAAIAKQISLYRGLGLGLKPDWVILDPEGYPDSHSGVDSIGISTVVGNGKVATVTTIAPTGVQLAMTVNIRGTGYAALNISNAPITKVLTSRSFTIASSFVGKATYGTLYPGALIRADWAALLNGWRAGIASVDPSLKAAIYASESEYTTAGLGNQSMPVFVAIAWVPSLGSPQPFAHSSNVLGFVEWGNECSSGTFQKQLKMLTSPPWNGVYNTVQFNPGVYCKPTAP